VIITKSTPFTKEEIKKLSVDKITLLSLAMDLKRITTSIQGDSQKNAERFSQEAKHWLKESQKNK